MQLICKSTLNTFINALGYNRQGSAKVRAGTSTAAEITLAISEAYQAKVAPLRRLSGQLTRIQNKELLDDFYKNDCKIYLVYEDALAVGGFVVLNGELIGFHNIRSGHGAWMLDHAIKAGAVKLDCFDVPVLRRLYESAGFGVVKTEPNRTVGEPDIIYMEI